MNHYVYLIQKKIDYPPLVLNAELITSKHCIHKSYKVGPYQLQVGL